VDYDVDGQLDLLLVGEPRCALYRNLGGGHFVDVTAATALGDSGRWMGCAVGDFDNDGFPDLLITGYRTLRLYRNEQGRVFRDVTATAGLATKMWTTSAAFMDVENDGDLDLYVAAYVRYTIGSDDLCQLGPIRTACGPEQYAAERGALYENTGAGRFVDVTRRLGLDNASGKTWGVVPADFDQDGWMDLYLANDMVPCDLFHNRKGKRFENVGQVSGTAFDRTGQLLGGMGADWGDTDGDGLLDLVMTTYFMQPTSLYRNAGRGMFEERSLEVGLAQPTKPYVKFGCGLIDVDNDGDQDLFAINGHVRSNISQFDQHQRYRQPLQLLRNQGDGKFVEDTSTAGRVLLEPMVGRGCAFGDYDNDGDVDVLAVDLDGPARLLRNSAEWSGNRSLTVRLRAERENVEGIGARIRVTAAERTWTQEVRRARSILSASDASAHFGLGTAAGPVKLEIRWPGGARTERSVPAGIRQITVKR